MISKRVYSFNRYLRVRVTTNGIKNENVRHLWSKEATTPRQELEHLCIQHSSTKVEENTRYDYILK